MWFSYTCWVVHTPTSMRGTIPQIPGILIVLFPTSRGGWYVQTRVDGDMERESLVLWFLGIPNPNQGR